MDNLVKIWGVEQQMGSAQGSLAPSVPISPMSPLSSAALLVSPPPLFGTSMDAWHTGTLGFVGYVCTEFLPWEESNSLVRSLE